MSRIEQRLRSLGILLPEPLRNPPGVELPFPWIRVVGSRALGSLDRIAAWVRVFGMVNSAPDFDKQPAVINGFTDLIVDVFGRERGAHARSAVGMAALPFGIPVEIEGEVQLVDA